MSPELAVTVQQLFLSFNQEQPAELQQNWEKLQKQWPEWQQQSHSWPQTALAGGNLASQLVQFAEKQLKCSA